MYDLKITGGTIVDGSGADRYVGDIAVKDGKIVAIKRAARSVRPRLFDFATSASRSSTVLGTMP